MTDAAFAADPAHANRTPDDDLLAPNLGAVFTRRWVAELILDVAGYTADRALHECVVIEPSCGAGAIVTVLVQRLVESCRRDGVDVTTCRGAIVALDIDPSAVTESQAAVAGVLAASGIDNTSARALAREWVQRDDFLAATGRLPRADWVVGNPPYVRIEEVDQVDMRTYRREWATMSGRADLYVGFFEAGLSLLKPEGRLSFICADRWMRNRYGTALRRLVESRFALDLVVVMHEVDAFEDRVAAYPAITVIRNGQPTAGLMVEAERSFDVTGAERITEAFRRGPVPVPVDDSYRAAWVGPRAAGGISWPAGSPERLALLVDLEARFPTLAETGAHVRVGAATGADGVFVVPEDSPIERDRLLPTLGAKETTTGRIEWRRRYLINPWGSDGPVSLDEYPTLAAYLRRHEGRLRQRHVAKRRPESWWRTIDRFDSSLADVPKLLIPDLKDRIHPVLDTGTFMPLHSLYYVHSDVWDLEVLGGLLMSDIANLFVESYSVRMANGYMRVSAQYLRRVRLPQQATLSASVRSDLSSAFRNRDVVAATMAARAAYGLSESAWGA